MQIAVLGINYKCADVSLREKIAKYLALAHDFPHVMLTTCNRCEIYYSTSDLSGTHSELLGLLKGSIYSEFEHRLYAYFNTDCFVHLAKVTAGLDSAIRGETEIQGQVKVAYERSILAKTASLELHFLFQKALHLAKYVRTTMPLSGDLLKEVVLDLCYPYRDKKILFIGLSEINRPLIRACKKDSEVFLMNRSNEKSVIFAKEEGIYSIPWGSFKGYDVLIFGTSAGKWLMRSYDFDKQSLILDLSVPRNVDPTLIQVVNLINIDQINAIAASKTHFIHPREELIAALSLQYIEAFRKRRIAKLQFSEEVFVG